LGLSRIGLRWILSAVFLSTVLRLPALLRLSSLLRLRALRLWLCALRLFLLQPQLLCPAGLQLLCEPLCHRYPGHAQRGGAGIEFLRSATDLPSPSQDAAVYFAAAIAAPERLWHLSL